VTAGGAKDHALNTGIIEESVSVNADGREWQFAKWQELLPAGSLRARLTVGVFWSMAAAAISRGLALGASIIAARLLGSRGYGELGIIQSTAGTFGVFAGLGLGLTTTKFAAEFRDSDRGKVGRMLALSSVAALVSSALMAVALVAARHYVAGRVLAAPKLAGPLAVGACLVFFGGLNGAQTGALVGFEAFQTIARVNVWAGLSSFPLSVIGVWQWGLPGAVWGLVGALAVNWVLNGRALRRECAKWGIAYDFGSCFREWPILHRFSLPALLASIVVGPALWFCNALLVRQPNGYAQLGLYTAADRWRLLILFIPTSAFGMLVPVLSNLYGSGDELAFRRVFRVNLMWISGFALLCALLVTAAAKPIMSVYGPAFRNGWPLLIVLSLSALPEALNTLLGHPLIVSGAMWWRFGFDVLLALMLVGLAVVFVPRWGAVGFACAYGLAFSLVSASLYVIGSSGGSVLRKTLVSANADKRSAAFFVGLKPKSR
jgi:O-antigen/teichoic acid export membrane protein